MTTKKRRRASKKSLGREGRPHGGNGLHDGMGRALKQLQAHEQGKNTKLFTESGNYRITDKAGNIDPMYFINLARKEKRNKEKNAKSTSTK